MSNLKIIKTVMVLLVFILFYYFFTKDLLLAPRGFTSDEAAMGFNGVLLGKTLKDENGITLPIFILANNGKDWKQPIPQYYYAVFMKLFGYGPFQLRLGSVIFTLFTGILLFIFLQKYFHHYLFSLIGLLLFFTTPIVFFHARYALDNHLPILFVTLWLFLIYCFFQKPKLKYLFTAGISLGIAFYSYKGMRSFSPMWSFLTLGYLYLQTKKIKPSLAFFLGILPFFLIAPHLNQAYPGSISDNLNLIPNSIYTLLLPYFSSFDPSFLFITGDSTPFHSTGRHGMFLLVTLPLFLMGIYQIIKNQDKYRFNTFVLISFFTGPLLFGLVNSIHRASRQMALLPAFVFIASFGIIYLFKNFRRYLIVVFCLLLVINFRDFYLTYSLEWAKFSQNLYGRLDYFPAYQALAKLSRENNLIPYVSDAVFGSHGNNGMFYQASYLQYPISVIGDEESLPPESLVLTNRRQVPGLTTKQCFETLDLCLQQNP